MYDIFLNSLTILILFSCAGISNIFADLSRHIPYTNFLAKPIDFGLQFRGKPLLGKNKTFRGLIFGTLIGSFFSFLISFLYFNTGILNFTKDIMIELGIDFSYIWFYKFSLLISFAALIGDIIESFFKRRLNIPSGKPWFPFDQTDFIIGACFFSLLMIRFEFWVYISAVMTYFFLHLSIKAIGFLLGLGKTAF